jgi:hypothetical protein
MFEKEKAVAVIMQAVKLLVEAEIALVRPAKCFIRGRESLRPASANPGHECVRKRDESACRGRNKVYQAARGSLGELRLL